jgi:hypothetical protein
VGKRHGQGGEGVRSREEPPAKEPGERGAPARAGNASHDRDPHYRQALREAAHTQPPAADTQDRGYDETEDRATPHHSPFCDPGAVCRSRLTRIPYLRA